VRKRGVQSPALLIVGQVCELSEAFDPIEPLPLHGRTVLVTRPKDADGRLTAMLRELGARVVVNPLIETELLTNDNDEGLRALKALRNIDEYKWLVLTSSQGVMALRELLRELNADSRFLASVKLAAVGAATAAALAKLGLSADYVPEAFTSVDLAKGLIARVKHGEKLLILRAADGSPELTDLLWRNGADFDDVAVYKTRVLTGQTERAASLLNSGIDCICFTSASTVKGFVTSFEGLNVDFTALTAACIGPATATEAEKHGFQLATASNATLDDLCNVVIKLLSSNEEN
jgi:uroporphyrinogen III methyltransferase/synthase